MKIILTGATGMVGEGVLNECLNADKISQVLIINRKSNGLSHPKLKEIVHTDFMNVSSLKEEFKQYDACLFCLGVSSVGIKEDEYFRLTHTLTLHFATTYCQANANAQFCYISGAGTDSSEKGRMNWARVKGKTENDLMKLPFKTLYCFRPGMLQPTKGLINTLSYYKYFGWLFPIIKLLMPNSASTLKQLGLAMINAISIGYSKQILEVSDIIQLSKK